MDQCGLSTGLSTESAQSTESRESRESPSPTVSEVSGWCSWRHSGYTCVTHTLDTTVPSEGRQSMSIIKKDLSAKLNKLLLVRNMSSAHVNADIVYANQGDQESTEGTSSFENRFQFRSGNDLPPPPPPAPPLSLTLSKRPPPPPPAPTITLTLPKRPESPRVTESPRATGSPKYPGSPRIKSKLSWDSQDTSFKTATTTSVEQPYKERLLLHNYLRTLQVQESTKKKSNMVINKYIILTFVLTNIMVLGFSVLGTILIMKNYDVCHCAPNTQAHIQIPDPDSLHRPPQDSPSMKHHSDETHDKKETPALQTGRVGLPAVADRDYKITISVTNNTAETGTEDFWNS